MPDLVATQDHDGVRVLTLNRPEKLNALNMALTVALIEALEAAEADDAVRSVVMAGAGRGFCAGADKKEFADLSPENAGLVDERAGLTLRVQSLPRQMSKPVIAAVHGVAMGGGAGLALAADLLVVSSDLRFGYPELKHGLVPALVMTLLSRHAGPKLSFELFSQGRILSGDELSELGLANRAVSSTQVAIAAMALARNCADRPPAAMRESKRLLYAVSELPFPEAMEEGRKANVRMRGFAGGTRDG